VQIRLGANFPLMVLPATKSVAGVPWRRVTPLTVARASTGWVPASAVTSARPAGTTNAGFDALDPALAAYLARHRTQVGVTVLDMTHGVMYRYNSGHAFIAASSVKVPIMLALLRKLEAAGRRPTTHEVALLTAMIEHSDNNAATALDLQVGDRAGLQRFATALGLTGFKPGSHYDDGWGWGTLTPDAMVRLLTQFQRGKVLTSAADTRLARTLMSNVEDGQRFGVGTTAPAGATVLLKNGWVPGPDGLWVANSSGIVITARDTYVIAVYTAHDASLSQGRAILEHVCAAVSARLK
jgi:beta-lactamase class A